MSASLFPGKGKQVNMKVESSLDFGESYCEEADNLYASVHSKKLGVLGGKKGIKPLFLRTRQNCLDKP